jgi:hypothetical protein
MRNLLFGLVVFVFVAILGGAAAQTDIDVVPVSMGSGQSINNTDLNFFTISQRVQLYAPTNADLGGTSYALSQGCIGGPAFSHIVLTGHLEKGN